MPVRCPVVSCGVLLCESVEGSDYILKFTCKNGHKFWVSPAGYYQQPIDRKPQPMVAL